MRKITANDPEIKSVDILVENIQGLRALFPEAMTEEKVDFEVLKQLLGGMVDEREEKYGLNWHGKRRARQLALMPSTGTLRPRPEDSVEWDTTKNLMIEGENLEVLKLLQKSYSNMVKLIYIDPPYNTGKDFVYTDDFRDNIKNYQRLTGQVDDGGRRMTSHTESSGRFHTDWLNMMYPRLKLARNLLREDGVIFVSIDEIEYAKLRFICDEIFGEENHIADFVWYNKRGGGNDAKHVAVEHEYVVFYAKSKTDLNALFVPYAPTYLSRYKEQDETGKYFWDTFKRKSGKQYYAITCPDGTILEQDDLGNPLSWLRSEKRFKEDLISGEARIIKVGEKWSVQFKQRLPEGKKPRTIFLEDSIWKEHSTSRDGNQEMLEMFSRNVFDNPKPVALLNHIISFSLEKDDLVLDFFAGSGTTGHAVMAQNAADGGNRRYILVQLPEPLDPANDNQKIAADFCDRLGKPRNIAELTKERLRRAARKIQSEFPDYMGDLGFRVFTLDSSNIRAWKPDRENLEQTLLDHLEHIKEGRSELDILYELVLKFGLDLCASTETCTIAGKTVYAIGGGVLLACLESSILRDDVEPLALGIIEWHRVLAPVGETICVFRDSAFADDVAKFHLTAILREYGLNNVRSL